MKEKEGREFMLLKRRRGHFCRAIVVEEGINKNDPRIIRKGG